MANINVRAKDSTINTLKNICNKTGDTQGQVIEKSLDILSDLIEVKKQFEKDGSLDDTLALTVFAKLMLNNVK